MKKQCCSWKKIYHSVLWFFLSLCV